VFFSTTYSSVAVLIARSSSSFELVVSVYCLAALDLGAGVEQPFDYLVIQNHQAMQSMGRPMDWTFEGNMVDGLSY